MGTALPYTPGIDGAGVVAKVGKGVDLQVGDRVYVYLRGGAGTYREQLVADASAVYPLDAALSFEQGAGIGIPYGTVFRALVQRLQAKAGETVLIHGASGACGIAAVQLATAFGLRVVGTAGSAVGAKLVQDNGADQVLRHDQEGYLDGLSESVDLVLEMRADINLAADTRVLSQGGRIAVIGNRGETTINARELMKTEADIRGVALGLASDVEVEEIHAAIGAGLAAGTLRPVVSQTFPLEEAGKAQDAVIFGNHNGAAGKVVLTMGAQD